MRDEVLSLILRQVETVVDETPSEIFDVKLAVTIVVHGLEDSCNSLDSTAGAIEDFCLDLSDQVLNAERLKLLHWDGVASVGRVANEPDVLVVLELGGHISRDISLVLEGKVLRAFLVRKRVAHDLLLAAEVICVALFIRAEVVARAAVPQQNWLIDTNWFSLLLHTEVGVTGVHNPHTSVSVLTMHGGLVESGDGRVIVLALRGRAEQKNFAEGVWVRLDADFLTVSDDVVRAEDVGLFNTYNLENGTVSRSDTFIGSRRAHIALISAWQLVVDVHCKPTVSHLALEHETVT